MPELTDEGQRIVGELAQRHAFSSEATLHMTHAVMNGNGQMAQFSHPEFAGSGQWMRGGMIMIGDMFNSQLKGRIDSLCSDIANALAQSGFQSAGSFQSQTQSGSGNQNQMVGGMSGGSSLFAPDPARNWWPQDLGIPNAVGSQNDVKYAYFASPRRLAVQTGASVWVYDTKDHQIGGFSQQQGSVGTITFTSQFGTVQLSSLPVVMRDGVPCLAEPVASIPIPNQPASEHTPAQAAEADIFASIEKLSNLKSKGILTDEEFSQKKRELLARL
jgi:hypothetical protein